MFIVKVWSLLPPVVPLAMSVLVLFSSLLFTLPLISHTIDVIMRASLFGYLVAVFFVRYKTVASSMSVEVDGFVFRPPSKTASSIVTGTPAASISSSGKPTPSLQSVSASTWPPAEVLGWTPFSSLAFNQSKPRGAQHFWSKAAESAFQVRSVGYKQSKQKESSAPPLYECIGVDLVKSTKLVTSIANSVPVFQKILSSDADTGTPYPWLKSKDSKWTPSMGIPRLLIINTQLPYSSPSLWAPQSADSDPGFSLVSYYAISPWLADSLSAGKADSKTLSAVTLLKRLIAEGKSEKENTALKCIGIVDNMEEVGFPDIVAGYNGKPVLVTKSAKLTMVPSQSNCELLEVEFDVRMWSIIARKTLHSLRDKFKDARGQIGMVIEGKTDGELPEQVLGCFRINYLDIMEAKPVEIASAL